jgi:bla regulator protein BlaR1
MGIWIAGIVVFAIITLMCNKNLRLIKESMKPMEDAKTLFVFKNLKAELGIKRNILLGTSVLVKTPMTVGFFKTRIILPAEKISLIDTRYALLHELTHCKTMDIPVNGVMCVLQGLHWFNPLVYLAFKGMRADREVACDTAVLKRLPEDCHINYGETLLNFASTMSRSPALSFAADMGGSKPQIIRRVKHIASYTKESRLLKIKSVCVFVLTGLLILSQIPAVSALAAYDDGKYRFAADNIVYEDLSAYFDGFEGSIVLYDLESDSYTIHNRERSVTRVSPASTYKIYSALIAMDAGVISPERSARDWNGTDYPYEPWNSDQNLLSAMQNSVSWYFQDIDAQVGVKELESYFTRLSYGNHNLSGGIADYWMESSLKISPVEQVELLTALYRNDTIFDAGDVDTLKDVIRLSEKNGAALSGKTGTGSVNGKVTNGWFIGYVENGGRTTVFATSIGGEDDAGGSAAVQITLAILKDKGIY